MNPRQMKKMMRQMGMELKELPVKEVVIRLEDGEITIRDPAVNVIEVQGQKTYQISGGVESTGGGGLPEEDIEVVAAQAGVSKEKAKEALEKADGDLAAAILSLTQ
ncbi:MAG: nascent polypeptide-associated complex protein [Methanobacteriota archaeon]|nr:MAG: nascent polypeptide-associated complex protein [Euryarchaeota archaeon]